MKRSLVVVPLVLALGGCSIWGMEGGPGGAGAAAPSTSGSAVPSADAVAGADGVQRIEITAGDDLRFTPSVVRAHPGTVEFTFRNVGSTPHSVRVVAGAGTGNLNGGQTATVRVTVDQPGTYPFPCLYHVASGMQGTLIVAPIVTP